MTELTAERVARESAETQLKIAIAAQSTCLAALDAERQKNDALKTQLLNEARGALVIAAVRPTSDFIFGPGSSSTGWGCDICQRLGSSRDSIEHRADCILALTPAETLETREAEQAVVTAAEEWKVAKDILEAFGPTNSGANCRRKIVREERDRLHYELKHREAYLALKLALLKLHQEGPNDNALRLRDD